MACEKRLRSEIENLGLQQFVVVRPCGRAKRMSLRVNPKSRHIMLTAPKRVSPSRVGDFLSSHLEWIHRQIDDLPEIVPFVDGSVIPVMGADFRIRVFDDALCRQVEMDDSHIRVPARFAEGGMRVQRYLRSYAQEKLDAMAQCKALALPQDKRIKSVGVRDTRSRWGSCSSDGRLNFSWRLIFAPTQACDYVVAHEVAHLVHMNHSQDFWALCSDLSVDFEAGKGWMRKNGHALMRYGQTGEEPKT